MRAPRISSTAAVVVGLAWALGVAGPAFGQAWLPPKGEASVSLSYQNLNVTDHLMSDGSRLDAGRIRASSAFLDLGYGITDRLAVSASLPYVTARYRGVDGESDQDDGHYHGTVQDLRLNVRYAALTGSLAVAPFFEAGIPTHAYPTLGHVAVGRDLKEYLLGVNVGRQLDPFLPDAYLQARYSYAFVETIPGHEDHRTNRSNLDAEAGYLVTRSLTLMAVLSWQKTHGGIDWDLIDSEEGFHAHDRLARSNFLRMVGGASYQVTPRMAVYADFGGILHGENTHAGKAIALGTAWTFGRKATPPESTDAADPSATRGSKSAKGRP